MPKSAEKDLEAKYEILGRDLAKKNVDIERVKEKIKQFKVEVPSWIFGAFGGGRFSGYLAPGAGRNVYERFDDAAFVNKLTGATPNVSLQMGWDDPDEAPFYEIKADSFRKLKSYAVKLGLGIGAINPTYFMQGTQFGSMTSLDAETRQQLVEHSIMSAEIAERFGNKLITVWIPDGSLYPGQVNMRTAERNLKNCLIEIYRRMPKLVRMLIEYKLFEPGTYHTVVSDYGVAVDFARSLGDRAGVLIDLGHHPHGVNVEHIVARLIEEKVPAGFHFNTRYAADDDHAVEPNTQLFGIFHELVLGGVIGNPTPEKDWVYVIDQASALENRVHAVLHSVDSLMVSYAKAMIVDEARLLDLQSRHEIMLANRTLLDAFLTDVRPILQVARIEKGLPADPVEAYVKSGYQQKIDSERAKKK